MNFHKNTAIFAFKTIFLALLFSTSNCKLYNKINSIESQINKNIIHFSDISSKCLIEYKDKKQKHSFNATYVCYYDSILYFNITLPLGISAAKIKIKKDTTYYINSFSGQNLKFNTADFFKSYKYKINYKIIQSIMLARLFAYPSDNSLKNYKYTSDTIKHLIYTLQDTIYPHYTIINHVFNIKNNIIESTYIDDYTNYSFLKCYYDYKIIDNKYYPKFISLQLIQKDTVFIKIRFKNVKINTKPIINF